MGMTADLHINKDEKADVRVNIHETGGKHYAVLHVENRKDLSEVRIFMDNISDMENIIFHLTAATMTLRDEFGVIDGK